MTLFSGGPWHSDAADDGAAAGTAVTRPSRTVVFANEKGGTGKSTTAMHLIVSLLRQGYSVASVDIDGNQASLTRYVENRMAFAATNGLRLPVPVHQRFQASTADSASVAEEDDRAALSALLHRVGTAHDFVVVDCPGAVNAAVAHAVSHADTLITPVNDSFIDLDLLGRVDGTTPHRLMRPSRFSEFVWEQRKARAMRDRASIDWIVLRNRLNHLDSRNMRAVAQALTDLSRRIGFTFVDGFGERVVFRELFPQGLTVLDLRDAGVEAPLNLSHVAARQEIRRLIDALGLVIAD